MKLAFLIMADKDPAQFSRLITALDDPRFDIFVHIDKKSSIEEFQKCGQSLLHSQIHFLQNRIRIYWGDISMVEAMLALYQTAMESGDYDRFILLSGCDYPIASNNKIYEALSASEKEYIIAFPLTLYRTNRVENFWPWKLKSKKLFWIINKSFRMLHWNKKPYVTVEEKKWPVYTSSQWTALSQDCVAYILETIRQNPCIMRYFRYSYAPDELVLPTIIANSEVFSQKASKISQTQMLSFDELPAIHYLRHASQNGSTVAIYDESAFDQILMSDKLFVRKLCSNKSERLCEMLHAARSNI